MKYRNIYIITKQLNIVSDKNKTLLLWENSMNFPHNFIKNYVIIYSAKHKRNQEGRILFSENKGAKNSVQ